MRALIFRILTASIACAANLSAQADGSFTVGVIAPLTGALAEYGVAAKNGIELARELSPQNFRNVRFVYEDSQWDAKTAVSAFSNLTRNRSVNLVFNWGNPITRPLRR